MPQREARFHMPGAAVGDKRRLDAAQSRYALDVLRLQDGAPATVFGTPGLRLRGIMRISDSDLVEIEITEAESMEAQSARLSLAFAPPKGKRADFLIEKCAELGVSEFIPLLTARGASTGRDLRESQIERWRRLGVAAARQCGRDAAPEVRPAVAMLDFLADVEPFDGILIAHPDAEKVLSTESVGRGRTLAIIGPEGGFTALELDAAVSAGAEAVGLGRNILRIETACMLVAGVLMLGCGGKA
ncbi:MAG TPA: RsmE family RNA methyltransferase [Candidatus Brocadiia bacterium]|nr:RsmE family RNA methyltransferase [Candidatus Brocadiia bacterium]